MVTTSELPGLFLLVVLYVVIFRPINQQQVMFKWRDTISDINAMKRCFIWELFTATYNEELSVVGFQYNVDE